MRSLVVILALLCTATATAGPIGTGGSGCSRAVTVFITSILTSNYPWDINRAFFGHYIQAGGFRRTYGVEDVRAHARYSATVADDWETVIAPANCADTQRGADELYLQLNARGLIAEYNLPVR